MIGSPTTLVRADSTEVPVRTVSVPVTYQGVTCVEMSVRDVAQQVRLQRQLAQSQKMETVGRLAAGLARDFSDIIDGIIGAASRAGDTTKRLADARSRERLEQQISMIRECSESAHAVVGRLLGFSWTDAVALEPIDLGRLVTDVAGICRNTFGDG
jgi:signal transduction histidine kinase